MTNPPFPGPGVGGTGGQAPAGRTIGGYVEAVNVQAYPFNAKGDGASDDTAKIQHALDQVSAAGGGSVFLPKGVYVIEAELRIGSNTEIFGAGRGLSVIRMAPNHTGTAIVNSDTVNGNDNIIVRDLEVDGNRANRAVGANLIHVTCANGSNNLNISIRNVDAHGSKGTAGANGLGIVLSRVRGGKIVGCRVSDNERDGITCYFDCQDVLIADNHVHNVGDDFIGLNAENGQSNGNVMTRCIVRDNLLGPGGTSQGSGISVRGASRVIVDGNIISEAFAEGIGISNWNQSPALDIVVSNNIVVDAGVNNVNPNGFGISIVGARGVSSQNGVAGCERIRVYDNLVIEARAVGMRILNSDPTVVVRDIAVRGNIVLCSPLYASGRGIFGESGPCSGISISNNTVWNAPVQGIAFEDAVNTYSRLRFEGNQVFNSGDAVGSTSTSAVGIRLIGVEDAALIGNVCTDLRVGAAKTARNGIRIQSCTGTFVFADNDCRGNAVSSFSLNDTASLVAIAIRDNPGFFPWTGQTTIAAGGYSNTVVGGFTYYHKQAAIVYGVPFPAGATPTVLLTPNLTGFGAVVQSPTNTGMTVRAWSLRNDEPQVVVGYDAQPNA